eukprot:GEZU01042235.1.p1 GENE.GEZU01042235.1~~GEZU01042235.1.p1  ORF type:complete len:152 (+),score=22.17 GEZU01042235.1:51-458(+)
MGFLYLQLLRRAMLERSMNSASSRRFFSQTAKRNGGHGHDHKLFNLPKGAQRSCDLPYNGFNGAPPTAKHHTIISKVLGAVLWVWVLYRFKEDGAITFGLEEPHWKHPTGQSSDDDGWSDSDTDDENIEDLYKME